MSPRFLVPRLPVPLRHPRPWGMALVGVLALVAASCGRESAVIPPGITEPVGGLSYTNERIAEVPWSIHVVRVPRTDAEFTVHSVHARGEALGLSTLSEQVRELPAALGTPVAAVNGDFYQRDRIHAGDPRGLQIVESELLSGPSGGVAFWSDAAGQPHLGNVESRFLVTWPDGTTTPFGLNEERRPDALVLYTPAAGPKTHADGGRELILKPEGTDRSALRVDTSVAARVLAVSEAGDSPLRAGTMVLSAGPVLAKKLPQIGTGATLQLAAATTPDLSGVHAALGGGPVLVQRGRVQKIRPPEADSYEFSSMLERHPRTAIGWNTHYFYLVEVDGRQKALSAGMTLEELAAYMARLGCEEAMNLDGGGSATLWFEGQVRNSPCDGMERPIANALVISRAAAVPPSTPSDPGQR